jgi:hypothetical protein
MVVVVERLSQGKDEEEEEEEEKGEGKVLISSLDPYSVEVWLDAAM